MHKVRRIEIANFRGDLTGVGRSVERGDVVYRGFAGDEVFPEGILADAVGGDDSQPRDHDPTGVSISHMPPKGSIVKAGLDLYGSRKARQIQVSAALSLR